MQTATTALAAQPLLLLLMQRLVQQAVPTHSSLHSSQGPRSALQS